jgi:hypothetical protein
MGAVPGIQRDVDTWIKLKIEEDYRNAFKTPMVHLAYGVPVYLFDHETLLKLYALAAQERHLFYKALYERSELVRY